MNSSQIVPLIIGILIGLPILVLLVSGIGLFLLSVFVPRHRMMLKLGLRNIARRRTQSLLIITGLTLSTTIITSALGIGDTMTASIRNSATSSIGTIDQMVSAAPGGGGGLGAFGFGGATQAAPTISAERYARLREQFKDVTLIDGITAALSQDAAFVNTRSGQGEPSGALFALGAEFDPQFAGLKTSAGAAAPIADLGPGEIYLNAKGAEMLLAQVGDTLQVYAGPQPLDLTVRAIISNDGLLRPDAPVAVLPLAEGQRLLGQPDTITSVLISNQGATLDSTTNSAAVTEKLRVMLIDESTLAELLTVLRTPEVSAAIASAAKTIEFDGLKTSVQNLQTELAATGTSDALRSLAADATVGAWLLGLDLPMPTTLSMATSLSNLSELYVNPLKADAVAQAEQGGQQFSQIFLVFSTFSILAGVLLVFLIFVMLAAERKSEMGMARAVGMKRRHLIQMFVTEGAIYDLLAALLGLGLGVAISYLMIGVIAGAFSSFGAGDSFKMVFTIRPQSLVLAYVVGVVLTFLVVTFSSWRVSRLNIVAAIRDLPEDLQGKIGIWRRIWRWSRGPLLLALGVALMGSGYASESQVVVGIGVSLGIIGAGLTLGTLLSITPLRAALRDRIVYTLIGVALLVLWLLPFATRNTWLGIQGYEQSEFVFFWAGLMMISGAIWVIVYNADLLLGGLNRLFGRFGNVAPILKTATAYPLAARFRTGMALAMFALVMFTIIAMVVIVQVNDQFFARRDELTGGFDLQASVLQTSTFGDLKAALANQTAVDPADLASVASLAYQPMEIRQVNAKNQVWQPDTLLGFDPAFVDQARQHYALTFRAPGYADDAAVWQALRERDDVIVVTRSQVGRTQASAAEGGNRRFVLQGFTLEDASMPAIQVELRDPASGTSRTLQVIGVLEDSWYGGVQGNLSLIGALSGAPATPSTFVIKLRAGANEPAIAAALEKTFLTSGMNVVSFDEQIDAIQAGSSALNNLLIGFVALGLVVGIAALGVITSRSVVERRQQIGMLRAIGYKQRMVWMSFVLESSFISLLGILIGTVFGLVLAWLFINDFAKDQPGFSFQPPWLTILAIVTVAYLCSLVTTILPARKASKIYPAEALRYE
ncbi:MAG: FtsX-like permease family protein [Herpetosiphonaceae bacterium]|nr:FtsX-like permease family protein [Herpetosiphonaceae bacterium]